MEHARAGPSSPQWATDRAGDRHGCDVAIRRGCSESRLWSTRCPTGGERGMMSAGTLSEGAGRTTPSADERPTRHAQASIRIVSAARSGRVDALGRLPRNAGSQAGGARCGAAKRRCEALQSIPGAAAAAAAPGVAGAGGSSSPIWRITSRFRSQQSPCRPQTRGIGGRRRRPASLLIVCGTIPSYSRGTFVAPCIRKDALGLGRKRRPAETRGHRGPWICAPCRGAHERSMKDIHASLRPWRACRCSR